jgi:hypothetical protein
MTLEGELQIEYMCVCVCVCVYVCLMTMVTFVKSLTERTNSSKRHPSQDIPLPKDPS